MSIVTIETTTTRKVSLTLDGRETQFEVPGDATDEMILGAARETAAVLQGRPENLSNFVVDRASPSLVIVRPKVPFGA